MYLGGRKCRGSDGAYLSTTISSRVRKQVRTWIHETNLSEIKNPSEISPQTYRTQNTDSDILKHLVDALVIKKPCRTEPFLLVINLTYRSS